MRPEVSALERDKRDLDSLPAQSQDMLAQAVLAQSQALTNLVQQLAHGQSDPIIELGASSSLGMRGSSGRAKLQADLAAQKGTFFLEVMAAMSRRMAPTQPAEGTPLELFQRGICGTRYLERFGGYSKHRDLGAVQWQVMTALDHLQTENWQAARDTVALLCVMLEQAVMDGGKFDLAQILVLQDDLPSSIFVNRNAGAMARTKSFSPLANQRWITVALAYIKEMDTIQAKRAELGSTAKASEAAQPSNPKPKAIAKRKGKGKGSNQTKQEEEEEG